MVKSLNYFIRLSLFISLVVPLFFYLLIFCMSAVVEDTLSIEFASSIFTGQSPTHLIDIPVTLQLPSEPQMRCGNSPNHQIGLGMIGT